MKFSNGKAQELTGKQKIVIGLNKAATQMCSLESDRTHWITSPEVEEPEVRAGDRGNTYTAKGTCVLNSKVLSTGDILLPQKKKFTIEVRDRKDEWGLPDIVIEKFTFK